MALIHQLSEIVLGRLESLYGQSFSEGEIQITQTKPEFRGDYTVVLFALVKKLKKAPEALGQEFGLALTQSHPSVFSGFNVIKGFLNLEIRDKLWQDFLEDHYSDLRYGYKDPVIGNRYR